ncbi:MAG: ABC transporter ATP-binding protein [Nitrososphaeria archaeon]
MDVVVGLYGIHKKFPGVKALDDVTVELNRGEIHAVLGENGAGKTTLMNILFGLTLPDKGSIRVYGKDVKIKSPSDALKLGIGMVHQHFSLIPTLNVIENFKILSVEKKIDENEILELEKRLNLHVDLNAKVGTLSAGERQRLEVLRLLYFNFNILIFDEPTSVLTPVETDMLLKELRKIVSEGKSIFFISHKLNEVKYVSDRITVLRRGKVVWSGYNDQARVEDLVNYMIGSVSISEKIRDGAYSSSEELLKIEQLRVKGERSNLTLNMNESIVVNKNEIVGIAGVAGNGQLELFDAIMGLRKIEKGRIFFNGKEITHLSARDRIEIGIGYIPEDRISTGVAPDLSVKENLLIKLLDSKTIINKLGLLNERKMNEIAEQLIKEYDIRTPSINTPVKNLSGGNLQKVILAREISLKPKLLLAYEPTKGLDVGATFFIRSKLYEYAKNTGSVLIYSEDLEELLQLCDRIYVIYKGDIVAQFNREEFNEYNIGKAMMGLEIKR